MKVKVLTNTYYQEDAFTLGKTYLARLAPDGKNYMVLSNFNTWLCLLPNEVAIMFDCEKEL